MRGEPSFQTVLEEYLDIEVMHPGGLDITRELARMCDVGPSKRVLDNSAGTGESAIHLAETFGCEVVGVELSRDLVERAKRKLEGRDLPVEFREGSAHRLPFEEGSFDIVLSEFSLSLMDKEKAIREMKRVLRRGGMLGLHDVCWKKEAPRWAREELMRVESARPETAQGWEEMVKAEGLKEVRTVDRPNLISKWIRKLFKDLGVIGQLDLVSKIRRRWNIRAYLAIRRSRRIYKRWMDYQVVVGKKE
ncbi:MAG: class I SAM-dependent methyltransferase [Methanomassiliicoccales archaeon]